MKIFDWCRKDMPLWWRLVKLNQAADTYSKKFIVYTRGALADSLCRSNREKDRFYNRHLQDIFPVTHKKEDKKK